MGRKPCCEKVGLKKGAWAAEEDEKLKNFVLKNGPCCWRTLPKLAGLRRCGKSCRLRWINYLRPDLKRGLLSEEEENMIIELHSELGNRWSKIASHLPGRTDNEIKNHWNTHIKKKLIKMGIDPLTHNPPPLPTTTPTPPQEQLQEPPPKPVDQQKGTANSMQSTITEGKDEDRDMGSSPLMEFESNMESKKCSGETDTRKGPWSVEEDTKLSNFILKNGQCCWKSVPKLAGLARRGKSCRMRWTNYLRPNLKKGFLSEDEEKIVIDLHAKLGNRWSEIASHLPGRTDNKIKNHWNTHIKKKLISKGIDPLTHKPLPPASSDQPPENQEPPFQLVDQCRDTETSTITEEKSMDISPFDDFQFPPDFIDYSEIMSVLYGDSDWKNESFSINVT